MADLEEAIVARVVAHTLGGLVGATPRVYNVKAPQKALLPLIVFGDLTVVRRHTMGVDSGVLEIPVRFTVRANSLNEARLVDAQLRDCFSRFRGAVGGVTIQDTLVEGTAPDFNPDLDSWEVETDITFWTAGS